MARTYDPRTGTWKSTGGGTKSPSPQPSSPKKNTSKKTTTKKSGKKSTKKTSKKVKKKKSTGKRTPRSFNYFTAKIKVVPTNVTMKIKPSKTVSVLGVGNYLGGKFYVQDVTTTLDSGGLSLEFTVIKVKFAREGAKPKKKSSSKSSKKKTKTRTHKVKKGETLLSIVKKYFKKKSKKVQKKHLNKMKKKNKIKNEKKKLKVGRKIYIV